MAQAVTPGGGGKLLPKRGRNTDGKTKYDRKNYAGGPKLGSYSVDKTNKDCSKLGQTKQSKQQNDSRVDQQHTTGTSSGTGSFRSHFRNSFVVARTGSFVKQFKQRLRRNVENMRQSSKNKTEFNWNLKQAREKLQSAIITAGLKSRIEVVIDGFCGTASSCALYHLKRSPRTVVVGIDRDQTSAFVHSFIPKEYHHRFMFLKQDMLDIKWDQVARVISNRWRGATLINLVHLHLSPSCISMSKADRFSIHRHADGLTPKSMTAIADDAVIEHCVKLLEEIRLIAPLALYTVENPVNSVFPNLHGIRKLLKSRDWRMLATSYCKEAHPDLDTGYWPRKDTNVLTCGLPFWFHGKMCSGDCEHLVPGTNKHRVQLCSGNRGQISAQYTIRDPMIKGMIPHGLFDGMYEAHKEWRFSQEYAQQASEPLNADTSNQIRRQTEQSVSLRANGRELTRALESTAAVLQQLSSEPTVMTGTAASDTDDTSDSDDEQTEIDDDYLDEEYFDPEGMIEYDQVDRRSTVEDSLDEHGLLKPEEQLRLRPHVLPVNGNDRGPGYVSSWARFIPALVAGAPIWDCSQLRPGELLAADELEFDNFKCRGQKTKLLFVVDIKTKGIRVREEKRKVDHGLKFKEIAIQEGWNKRGHKVTVMADGCGSMVHLKREALELGIDFWDLAPFMPNWNPAEQAIGTFKPMVAAVLFAACAVGGPIDHTFAAEAAKYICWTHERFPHSGGSNETMVSAYELNLGVKPKLTRFVQFGAPGYAFVPKEVRARRGWSKTMKSEPVLMLGYQHMYSNVFRCLTTRGTIIHTVRVSWHLQSPLGIFLDHQGEQDDSVPLVSPGNLFQEKTVEEKEVSPDVLDTDVPVVSSGKIERQRASTVLPADPRFLTIRKNPEKGSKTSYIYQRCAHLDGVCVHDAIGRHFLGSNGKLRPYKWSDFNYDVATGWIFLEVHASDVSDAGQLEALTAHARSLLKPANPKVSMRQTMSNSMAFVAMRDLKWKPYLKGKEADHVKKAHDTELSALLNTRLTGADGIERPVMEELFPGMAEYEVAIGKDSNGKPRATNCRELLEFKRSGVWKARVVIQGFREDKLALDGADFVYSSNVVGLSAVRRAIMSPLPPGYTIGQVDVATAFLQADMFPPDATPRYLRLFDPVAGTVRWFRQYGVIYGSCSAPARWQATLHPWIESQGFIAGKNEPCAFYNPKTKVLLESFVDDLIGRGPDAHVREFMKALAVRFKCKPPNYLTPDTPLDHLGMTFFRTEKGTYLSMENYINTMIHNLGLDPTKFRKVRTPISCPVMDFTPLSPDEAKFFMSGTGMIGWLAVTGRPDLKYCHSRISQHLATPTRGALANLLHAVRYCYWSKSLCLHQAEGKEVPPAEWSLSCDSDQSGNTEPQNKRRSQLGSLAMFGTCPIQWSSKASAVQFGEMSIMTPGAQAAVEAVTGTVPVCHPCMPDLHPDMSSAAAEIYAASVALGEFMHLSYINDEMGFGPISPLNIGVDNSTAIAFSEHSNKRSKLRHIDCRQLWVQALRDRNLCRLVKVGTEENLSDMFTKILGPIKFEAVRDKMMYNHPLPEAAKAA